MCVVAPQRIASGEWPIKLDSAMLFNKSKKSNSTWHTKAQNKKRSNNEIMVNRRWKQCSCSNRLPYARHIFLTLLCAICLSVSLNRNNNLFSRIHLFTNASRNKPICCYLLPSFFTADANECQIQTMNVEHASVFFALSLFSLSFFFGVIFLIPFSNFLKIRNKNEKKKRTEKTDALDARHKESKQQSVRLLNVVFFTWQLCANKRDSNRTFLFHIVSADFVKIFKFSVLKTRNRWSRACGWLVETMRFLHVSKSFLVWIFEAMEYLNVFSISNVWKFPNRMVNLAAKLLNALHFD